ncbi:PepSY-associated TM helix domain-containing protein [Flavobacterium sp. ST-87]|uniref:PepSY-associated TM helix domain-containing protein n=1 Tax=Flavobacterium plantiphilum TaxID=3163297 RepID=A0ABW8XSR9_9FLAO
MGNRDYNVFFNTHTVSGIIISIGLYVIFFAGAFALFMNNIDHWEANVKPEGFVLIDYDKTIARIAAEGYDMHGRNLSIYEHDGGVNVYSAPLKDTILLKSKLSILDSSEARGRIDLHLDEKTYQKSTNQALSQKTLGTFLYELHFFDQIPTVGFYLAGLVAVFFLFAIITGVIVHWRKIVSNFFTFRLKSSLKILWTDAHTALGVIGLPFQMMYAVTGSVFCLLVVISNPINAIIPDENGKTILEKVTPVYSPEAISINNKIDLILSDFSNNKIESVYAEIHNYHDENAELEIYVSTEDIESVFNYTKMVYRLSDWKLQEYKPASEAPPYAEASWDFIHIIHFGDYGGIFLKVLYFILALLTCVVVITGVMVWLVARDKKSYSHKAKFNKSVGAIYLGSCLGLYPAIAFMFLLTKTFPAQMEHRFAWISWMFLAFWVGYTVYSYIIKSYFKINRNALFLAGVMGILIPVFNGIHSGLWFWKSLQLGYSDSFFVDLTWLICGMVTLLIALKLQPQRQKQT